MSSPYTNIAYKAVLQDVSARNADGSGNNTENPNWGAAFSTLERVTDATYGGDGSGSVWDASVAPTAAIAPNAPFNIGTMPQPKLVSTTIFGLDSDAERKNSGGLNEMAQFFGQFLTHDIVQSVPFPAPGDAPVFYDGFQVPVFRTPSEIEDGVRAPISKVNAFLDLGIVYGTSATTAAALREFQTDETGTVLGGKLVASADGAFMPTHAELAAYRGITVEEVLVEVPGNFILPTAITAEHFATGDDRANQTGGLLAQHVVWFRNHNWHVDQLEAAFPDMSQEELYQSARALNEAEFQQVVYAEFLTKLLGKDAFSTYEGYKADVDPSVVNEWTSVAFRFGHDMSSPNLVGHAEDGTVAFDQTLNQVFTLANLGQAADTTDDLGNWLRGLTARSAQEIDGRVNSGLRDTLFALPGPTGEAFEFDLAALDIHRGRDHGVNDYNLLREGLGLSTYDSFEAFAAANNLGQDRLEALKEVYTDISQMDSLVGGLLETKINGGQMGETFSVLTIAQFEALRDGDSHFSLARFADNPALLDMISSTTLAEIMMRVDAVDYAYRDAFLTHIRKGGTDGDDVITGSPGRDLLLGFDGNDALHGGGGADDLYGGSGRDKLFGDNGDDYLYGEDGNDVLWGGLHRDLLDGGEGHDRLFGQHGNDTLAGGAGDDTLNGGGGRDELDGGAGDDRMTAGWGNDVLDGGAGDDRMSGGWGNDTLDGGAGDDRLTGGFGSDVFAFTPGSGHDRIVDFNAFHDRIDLSAYEYASFADLRSDISSEGFFTGTRIDLGEGDSIVMSLVPHWFLNEGDFIL